MTISSMKSDKKVMGESNIVGKLETCGHILPYIFMLLRLISSTPVTFKL